MQLTSNVAWEANWKCGGHAVPHFQSYFQYCLWNGIWHTTSPYYPQCIYNYSIGVGSKLRVGGAVVCVKMLWSRPPPHGSGQTAAAMPAIAIVYRQELNALPPGTFLITVRSMVWTYPLPPAKSGGVPTPMYRYSIHNINVHRAYTWITTNGKVYSLFIM